MDTTPILDNMSFSVKRGERVAILGATGSGKSTLFENLIGIKQPLKGEISINDIPMVPVHYKKIQKQIGYCFQDPNDQLFMPTILEDILFGPRNHGYSYLEAKGKAEKILAELGLEDCKNRSVHELSGGQKRLTALASILVMEPSILFLDEPTNGLDPAWRRRLINILNSLEQHTILVASHDLHWIGKVTKRCLLLSRGKIQEDRDLHDLLKDHTILSANGLPVEE